MKLVWVILALAILIGVGGAVYYFTQKNPGSKILNSQGEKASVSGTIGFNGTVPAGATVSVGVRPAGTTEQFSMVVQSLAAQDGVSWNWSGAANNKNYDIQAFLIENGKSVESSEIITVTAPAAEEELHINSDSGPAPTPNPQTNQVPSAVISGKFDLNGYYTSNTTITILQRVQGQSGDYQVAASGIRARDNGEWSWGGAVADTTYEMKARFISSTGANIGESPRLIVTAPAAHEVFVINSTAQPPAQVPSQGTQAPVVSGGAISGSINFNGAVPANSSIVILAKGPTDTQFQVVVNGIQPANGSTWSWNSATAGTSYTIMAILKQNNANNTQTDVATSQSMVATAPANNQVLTINSNVSLPAPSTGSITNVCVGKNQSNNTWSATVNFPSISGAQTYWYQIGTTSGSNNLLNTGQGAQNSPSQAVNITVNDSVTYYANYAYSNTPNAAWNAGGFSGFSGTYSFKCPT